MALIDSVIVFIVGLLVGALSIYIGASIVVGSNDFMNAVVTALIGALALSIFGFLFGFIPVLGPIITLLVWIGVINWQYEGGWFDATIIGFIAWISVLIILYILAVLGLASPVAIGVPV